MPGAQPGRSLLFCVTQHLEHVLAYVDEEVPGHLGSVGQEPQHAPATEGTGTGVRLGGPSQ